MYVIQCLVPWFSAHASFFDKETVEDKLWRAAFSASLMLLCLFYMASGLSPVWNFAAWSLAFLMAFKMELA
jgi:hypothetical protein